MNYLSNYTTKISAGLIILAAAFVSSCSKDESPAVTTTDTASVQGESVTDSYYDESNDFSTIAVGGTAATITGRTENGRTTEVVKGLGDIDNRLTCATVTVVKDPTSTLDKPKGVITIDFGTGCTDPKGNVRKGKITVTYSGRRFALNSTITTTFTDYYVNGIKIEGTNTLTNLTATLESSPKFKSEVVGGKVTFTDGKVATRDHVLTREWVRGANPSQDIWNVDGNATGTSREGVTYQMEITKTLVYKRACVASKVFIAVQGTKHFTSGDKTMTIDFGTGDCDNTVTITVNGVSKQVDIKADGSN